MLQRELLVEQMARKRPTGICHICGQNGPLSFEHTPPRAAFNDRPVVVAKFDDVIHLGPDETPRGPTQQRGLGDYTLCDKCNNDTGAWYGKRFVDWCYHGMDILIRAKGHPSLIYMHYLLPLSIIKQIVTMFLAINSPRFTSSNEELVRFVLNKETKYLSPKYRFFVYFNVEGRFRRVGLAGKGDMTTGSVIALSELSFTPFGYVMTLDAPPPDKRLLEITHFARYDYNEFVIQELRLPTLPTHLALPGDYRTKQEIQEDFQKNMQAIPG